MARSSRRICSIALVCASPWLACAHPTYQLRPPAPSQLAYEISEPPPATTISLVDRLGPERFFGVDVVAGLGLNVTSFDPLRFLSSSLEAELRSRGLPVAVTRSDQGVPRLVLRAFHMQPQRTTIFTPVFLLTVISADLETANGTTRIGVVVIRGALFGESRERLGETIIDQPLSVAVKELATKVASALYSARSSDAEVARLVSIVAGPRTPNHFLDVYALGFTNNPAAIEPLTELTADDQEYVRGAAIASLGTLRAVSRLELLEKLYLSPKTSWQDRCLAMKSIGDLGTLEALAFLDREAQRLGNDRESALVSLVAQLYR